MRSPKVIALHRTGRGRFAVDETGEWQPSNKTTLCVARREGLSVAYLGGVLNSELLDLWYAQRGRNPRDVWRDYEPKPMARIPYRHVDLSGEPTERVTQLSSGDHAARVAVCDAIVTDPASDAELAHALEAMVRSVADNRRALLALRAIAPALTATIKDPWRTEPPEINEAALLSTLPLYATVSVRIDAALVATVTGDGVLGRADLDGDDLRFRHARRVTATVTGDAARLELLARLVRGRQRLLADELEAVLLPKDAAALNTELARRADEIDALLEAGRELVERTERLVCRLYRVPKELEDEVVAHAVARAARAVPRDAA